MPNIDDARSTYAATLAFVPGRDELPLILNARGLLGCGVEVGVKQGEYSALLLQHWEGRHLISVDPWLEDTATDYLDIANVAQTVHESFLAETRSRLAPYGTRSTIWRLTSLDAAERIPRHSMDFVYLDARHDFESVLEDLGAWADKVRPGGIIAGHDYIDGDFAAGVFGVRSAVDGFFAELGVDVHATLLDEPWLTWMVEVPRSGLARRSVAAAGVAPAAGVSSVAGVTARPAAPTSPAASGRPPMVGAPAELHTAKLDFAVRGRSHHIEMQLDPRLLTHKLMLDAFARGETYEVETSDFLAGILEPGDVFVDVGAHVGYFSLLASALVSPSGQVVAFEPEPGNQERLAAHISRNGAAVRLVRAAVGERAGETELHLNADNDGGHALWDVGRHPFNERSRQAPASCPVRLVTLDGFFAEPGAPAAAAIKAIKIDAEGSELRVLQGAVALLRDHAVPYVVLEVNRAGLACMGTDETMLRGWLAGLGYETLLLAPGGGLHPLGDDQWVESESVFNLVFRHRRLSAGAGTAADDATAACGEMIGAGR